MLLFVSHFYGDHGGTGFTSYEAQVMEPVDTCLDLSGAAQQFWSSPD
jgi:hypothetical protein